MKRAKKHKTRRIEILENKQQQAAKLIELGFSFRTVSRTLSMSKGAVQRSVECARSYGKPTGRRGRRSLLSPQEREQLIYKIEHFEKINGTSPSISDGIKFSEDIMMESKVENRKILTREWFIQFVRNDPALCAVKGRMLEEERNVPEEEIIEFLQKFRQCVKSNKATNEFIFNMDESFISPNCNEKVIINKLHSQKGFARDCKVPFHLTMVACVCADNTALKPLAILDTKTAPLG